MRKPFLISALLMAGMSFNVHANEPADNPLLQPRLPKLPDLYTEEAPAPEENQDTFTPPPPTPAETRRRRQLANGGSARATKAIRAELQRQIAQFHDLDGRPDVALVHLLAAQDRGWLKLKDNQAALDAARLYRRLALPLEAQRLYSSLPDWQTPKEERQNFTLERIQSAYNRGNYRVADKLLATMGKPANPGVANQIESFHIRILMALGRFQNIARVFEEQLGTPRNNLYTRYNLGVSMVAGGKTAIGIGQLDELGSIPAIDPEPLALRDQANLSLGWAFLQADQGATARPFLRRIRLDGPAANRALLALGWALLAPDGEPQQKIIVRLQNCLDDPARMFESSSAIMRRPAREECGKPKVFKYKRDLEFEESSAEADKRLKTALKPWDILIKRSAHDPAVQEAMLARGFVLEQLNARKAAASAYRSAIEHLQSERTRIRQTRARLQTIPLSLLVKLSSQEDEAYLSELITDPMLAEARNMFAALQAYEQRLKQIRQRLDKLGSNAQAARARHQQLLARASSLHDNYEDVVKRMMNRHFDLRDEQISTYLKRARLALASLHGQAS